jgi:ABC-2 type transport system permease protein
VRSLFEAFGIDYDQWKALAGVALKIDLRVSSLGGGAVSRRPDTRKASVIGLLAFYMIMGGFTAVLVFKLDDVMLSATLVLSYLMFMVGAMILMDHNSVITSPDDYVVLGFRPMSSRTYFAVRLTNVFVYTIALTTAFGILPMASFGIAHGWRIGLASIPAFYLATTLTTLALVFVYAWLLRAVGADRLKRALSYLQLVVGFLVYGGYFLMSQLAEGRALGSLHLPDTPLMFLFPATWFASYLPLASGRVEAATIYPAAGSVVAIAVLAAFLGGRLSLQYAEQLGALTAATAARSSKSVRRRRPLWFTSGASRAIALLVRAQFRNDQKFRMAVLGILPLTVLYVFMSRRHGPLPDPFALDFQRAGDTLLITVAVMSFPTTLRLSLSKSDSFKASWIYFTSPVERSELVRATTNVLLAFFLLPYLAFVAAFLTYLIGEPVHVLVHMAFLGLLSHLLLQVVMLIDPALPFSQPLQKGSRSGLMLVTMMTVFGAGVAVAPLLSIFVYVSAVRIALVASALVIAGVTLDWLTRVRVKRLAEQMEFGA